MGILSSKIDFALVFSAECANVNGDPLNGNRPREDFDGYGEMSDVCIKRKIRNRLQDMGEKIFVQSDDRCDDGCKSLRDRAESVKELKELAKSKKREEYAAAACKEWIDVRAFGQVFAFGKGTESGDGLSVPVRGSVSIRIAKSVSPIEIVDMQITKSVNGETKEGKSGKSSDTMGMKHFVEFGVYVIKGSINCQLAEKTGFSDDDAEKIKEALKILFENDSSSARPDGSMQVCKLVWWKHNDKFPKYSTAKVHNSIKVKLKSDVKKPGSIDDYDVFVEELDGLTPEIFEMV